MRKKEKNLDDIDSDYLDMMVYNFNYAISHNLDNVYIGYVIVDDDNIKEYLVLKENWIKTTDILIRAAIEIEEYEYAAQLKKIKESL